jgi:rhodanese-related sulfurtransferase
MQKARVVVVEAIVVAVAGAVFALTCNALSPRGLQLSRNYFPGRGNSHPTSGPVTNLASRPTDSPLTPQLEAVLRHLQELGLQSIQSNDVATLFRDPRYEQGLVVFLDARDDQHYQAGHIPGAWQFNHYRAEQFLPTVLPLCLNAQQIVVYCNGGTCDDSEFAAIMLRDAGIPRGNLYVYVGGITEWMTNALPVETGARRSGQLLKSGP